MVETRLKACGCDGGWKQSSWKGGAPDVALQEKPKSLLTVGKI